jgi:plasmid stabilization system protein ParE
LRKKEERKMTEIVWAQEAKIQYLKVLNFLFDEWGEQLAIDFEEKIIKFEELISTGSIKFQYSKILGHEKCVIDKYNSIIFNRDNDRIQIVALIDNRSDHHF